MKRPISFVCVPCLALALVASACGGGSSSAAEAASSVKLQGAGASFPAPLYNKWFKEYSAGHQSVLVDYQSVGSGSGVKGVIDRTVDFGACDGLTLYVLDFKYGSGKAVKVERNTQLLCYALGALGLLETERPDLLASLESVCLAIVQPRAGGDPVRQWVIPVSDLIYWGFSTLKPTVEKISRANGGELPLTPGRHCFFCAASIESTANTRSQYAFRTLLSVFATVAFSCRSLIARFALVTTSCCRTASV